MVRTRCFVGGGQRLNCHKGELEHCLAIGRRDFGQLGLGGVDGARDMRPHGAGAGGGVAHGDEGEAAHDVVLLSSDDDEGAGIDVVLVSDDDAEGAGILRPAPCEQERQTCGDCGRISLIALETVP